MRLVGYELKKLFDKGTLVLIMVVVIFANLFLIWTNSDVRSEGASSGSYRAIAKDLSGLSLEEKKQFLDEKTDMFTALVYMEQVLVDMRGMYLSDEFKEYQEKYGDIYNFKQYTLYTDSLLEEYHFISSIQAELNTVYDYEGFLSSTVEQADVINQISIFKPKENEPQTFGSLNTEKTAAAYEHLFNSEIEIDYYPQKGIVTAINFFYTDVFILLFMLLISGQIVNSERESGMLYYIRTTPKGRFKTALSKVAALCVALFFVLIGLYGTNLLYCEFAFGLGDLTRSIQSLPFLFRATMEISVLEYLLVFLTAKWFVCIVLGSGIMLVILCVKKLIIGWAVSLAILGSGLLIRTLIVPLSNFNVLRHANFIGFLEVNEWLGSYYNLYWFGKPVEILNIVLISSGIAVVLFISVFLIYFANAYISPAKIGAKKRSKRLKATTVFKEEMFKLVLTNGVGLILLGFVLFQGYQAFTSESYITPKEIYYRHYIEPLSGRYTEDKYLWILEQSEEFEESYEMDRKLQSGEISEQQHSSYTAQNMALMSRREAFEQIIYQDILYINENKGAQFVNPAGYMVLYDLYNNEDTLSGAIISALLISVCLTTVFQIEKQSGMERLLKTTPLGRHKTPKSKFAVSLGVVVVITVATMLPQYFQVIRDYGLPAFFAPIKSLQMYSEIPSFMTFFSLSLISFIYRLAAGTLVGMTTLLLSSLTSKFLTIVSASCIIFCVPPLLTMYGIENTQYFSIYPMFHFGEFLTKPFGALFLVVSFACTLFFVIFFAMLLFELERDDFVKLEKGKP